MKLLIDIGNTRLKWALADNGAITQRGAQAHEGDPARVLRALEPPAPEAVWIASVTGAGHEAALEEVCRTRWSLPARFARVQAQTLGLHNAYAEPARLGVDRWLALIAAWAEARGACVVADAGTALTVDVIDAQGQHLGGVIAAGLQTAERAVLGATRFAVRRSPPLADTASALGRDTETCVRQGALLGCLGVLDRVAAPWPQARHLITGGDAPTLLPHLPAGWEQRSELVLEGLLRVADQDRENSA